MNKRRARILALRAAEKAVEDAMDSVTDPKVAEQLDNVALSLWRQWWRLVPKDEPIFPFIAELQTSEQSG